MTVETFRASVSSFRRSEVLRGALFKCLLGLAALPTLFVVARSIPFRSSRLPSSQEHMRFVTYTATPGLERFAERDRFGLWCSIHKRLMRTDPEYRNRVRRHRLTILGTTIPFCLATTLGLGHLGLPKFVEVTVY